jgi:hypothetical protein
VVVRVYGWVHTLECRRRATIQKHRSPEAVELLQDLVRRNMGKSNADIMTLYQREIATDEMAEKGIPFEEVLGQWKANAAKAPRDAAISTQVRNRSQHA